MSTDINAFTSVTCSQVSLGHGLWRLVDMFYSAHDLVEENDCRLELMAMNEDIVLQLSKCFPLLRVLLTISLLHRQEAMQQSYQELIMRVPLVSY